MKGLLMANIKIIDAPCGAGKTSFAIQAMNEDTENNYIYITPFLSEVQRIKDNCTNRKFYEPLNIGSGKLDSLHSLLKNGKNIASTHALFKMSSDITRELILANNYILILDEVCNVIEHVPLSKNDIEFVNECSKIDNDFIIWEKEEYNGRLDDIKQMSINHNLMAVGDYLLTWNFPIEIFRAFKQCYIMTYMFDAQIQKYYYDLHQIEYDYHSVIKCGKKYKMIPFNEMEYDKTELRKKIHIVEDDILNSVGQKETALSVTWFENSNNNMLIHILQKNVYNFFRNKMKAKGKDIMWTTFKKNRKSLSTRGFATSFLSVNARATNEYKDRKYLAYCANIFLNPYLIRYFSDHNIDVSQDKYALSEFVQWIFRSAIRENKDIWLYCPSSRMRKLLQNWLEE